MIRRFWLVDAAVMELPLSAVRPLAEEPSVVSVEAVQTGEPPPDSDPNNDVDDGRALIQSDHYFDLGLPGGRIALLDTGVLTTHVLFNSPGRLGILADCTGGGLSCTRGSSHDCWGHGTKTAGILSGNLNLANPYRGVTKVQIDSWRVYPDCKGVEREAVVLALDEAADAGAEVIVVEVQAKGPDVPAISQAADGAFDSGKVVIAADGNYREEPVHAPANAHRVIGVGAYDVLSQAPIIDQSWGPTPDGRIKPDILMPTNTETSAIASDTAIDLHPGTSGAAAYGGAAAMLLRNWMRRFGLTDPGQVYALLILSGQSPYPFAASLGAGRSVLWTDAGLWWGKLEIEDGETVVVKLVGSPATAMRLDAALWWPESGDYKTTPEIHNDIDLLLISPSGSTDAESEAVESVFERARVDGGLQQGTWSLGIRGYLVASPSQTVYWAAAVSPGFETQNRRTSDATR